jgi:outer membrane immunogenic protein
MKKFVLGAIGALAMVTSASAADLAARPYTKAPIAVAMYDWSGFYIGANGGWGSSRKCWDLNSVVLGVTLVPAIADGCHDASGGTAGGQFGYRWQSASWVFGLEAQGNWADFRGSNASLFTAGFTTNRTRIDAFGLFTGQVGYAWNNALLYVKGGGAVTRDRYDGLIAATGVNFDSARETRWGAVAGVGLEYGFAPNWSAAIEYDHMFMGNRDRTFTSTGLFIPAGPAGTFSRIERIRQDVDLVTVRINYRWGGPVVARY